jgi:hypothetical protein
MSRVGKILPVTSGKKNVRTLIVLIRLDLLDCPDSRIMVILIMVIL